MLIKLTSYLMHPYLDITRELCSIDSNKRLVSEAFSLLESNKVLLRVLSSKDSEGFPMKREVISKFMDSSRAFEVSYKHGLDLKEELLDIVSKFSERSIKSVLIKSLNTLPLDSDNFDILVMEKDLSASFKVLRDSGFLRISWYREPYKWLFRKVNSPRIAVHLHTAIAWDGIKFVDVSDLWKEYREKEIDGVIVGFPSPEHHMLITTAHAFFENREFRLGDLSYLIQDVHDNDLDWNYIDRTIQDGWSDSFCGLLWLASHVYNVFFGDDLISEETYELLLKEHKKNISGLAEKLVNQFREKPLLPMKISTTTVAMQLGKKILKTSRISFSEKAKMIWHLSGSFARRRIPICKKHPAFLVCFIGQDGTGKTTHAKYAWKELKQISKKIRVGYVWSRGFGYSFQPFLLAAKRLLLDNESLRTSQDSYFSRRTRLLKKEPMRSLWAHIMIMDHLLHLARVQLALSLGRIVICDRWIIDTLIDVECELGKPLSEFLKGRIECLAPKPQIAFIMDAQTSELIKRRPQVDLDSLECKRNSYLEQSDRVGFQVINSNDTLERNKKKINSAIIESLLSQSQ